MGTVNFDKLYENYNILSDAKDKVSDFSKEYLEAIEGAKGDEKEKKLAAQIISKFYKHFPTLQSQALEAIFDICEDDNSTIRIAAMKTLPMLYKECKTIDTTNSIACILAQLLQLDEPQEFNIAQSCLSQVLKEDPTNTIKNIFKQIHDSTDAVLREKCIKFITTKIKTLDKALYTTEVEDLVIAETKQLIQEAGSSEYSFLMPFLISTRLGSSISGQQELVEMTAQQVELDQEFLVDTADKIIDRLITCIKFVLPFFSTKVDSSRFVIYICDQILPQWDVIASLPNGESLQLAVVRELAELSTHCGKLENPSLYVVQIFDKLKQNMPPPPEDSEVNTMPTLEFTIVEGLLYAFHRLARQCPDFLTHDPSVLKDFRSRLMYFSRCIQGCQKSFNNPENLKDKDSLTPDLIKKRKITPKLLNNINMIIKDLFYQPPMYKCNVNLSYKIADDTTNQAVKAALDTSTTTTGVKRHAPITFDSNGSTTTKQNRNRSADNVKLYMPPSGKFSNNFNNYEERKGPGRFRGRGGNRNMRRPQGRNWRK